MATIYVGKRPLVFFFRPEHVRYFLTEHQKNFTKVNRGQNNLRNTLGDGLLTIDGDFHRQQRRLVQPAFHKRRIEGYANTMVQFTQEMLNTWQPHSEINISQAMQQLTLRIIGETLFHVDVSEQTSAIGQAFTDLIEGPSGMLRMQRRLHLKLPFTRYGKSREGKHTIDTFIYGLIEQRRSYGQDMGDVMSMLLEAQEGSIMSDKQVHDHVLTFVAAGHETAQNTLSWTFYLLSQYPEKRNKLIHQLQTVLNGRAPTINDLPKLPYLDWVINKSWRIMPPAWIMSRQAIDAFGLDGYHFPAGSVAMLSQWVIQNEPEIWGDPQAFRPERWDRNMGRKCRKEHFSPLAWVRASALVCLSPRWKPVCCSRRSCSATLPNSSPASPSSRSRGSLCAPNTV